MRPVSSLTPPPRATRAASAPAPPRSADGVAGRAPRPRRRPPGRPRRPPRGRCGRGSRPRCVSSSPGGGTAARPPRPPRRAPPPPPPPPPAAPRAGQRGSGWRRGVPRLASSSGAPPATRRSVSRIRSIPCAWRTSSGMKPPASRGFTSMGYGAALVHPQLPVQRTPAQPQQLRAADARCRPAPAPLVRARRRGSRAPPPRSRAGAPRCLRVIPITRPEKTSTENSSPAHQALHQQPRRRPRRPGASSGAACAAASAASAQARTPTLPLAVHRLDHDGKADLARRRHGLRRRADHAEGGARARPPAASSSRWRDLSRAARDARRVRARQPEARRQRRRRGDEVLRAGGDPRHLRAPREALRDQRVQRSSSARGTRITSGAPACDR